LEGLQTSIKFHLDKLNGLSHEVDYHTKVFRRLDQRARLGVSSYHNTCKEYEDIDSDITKAKQALVATQAIVESVQNQVEHMQLRFGICIFPLPILHPCEQAKD
jgi:predicted  nucleic acid-binding Zn-ribbon protein